MKLNFWQILGLALIVVCGSILIYRRTRPLPPPTPPPAVPSSQSVTTAPAALP